MIQSAVLSITSVSLILNNPERCEICRPEALKKLSAVTAGPCMQKINTIAIIVYFLSERAFIIMQYIKGPF